MSETSDQWIIEEIKRGTQESLTRQFDLPHVVYVFDRLLGTPSVIGPFPDPITASLYVDEYLDVVAVNDDDRRTYDIKVIRLEPADEPFYQRSV